MNERFGRAIPGAAIPAVPFGVMLQTQVDIGPDRRRAFLERIRRPREGESAMQATIRVSQGLIGSISTPAAAAVARVAAGGNP